MSEPHYDQSTTELVQPETNVDIPDIENVEDVIHIPVESSQPVFQGNDDETRVDIPPKIDARCIYRVSPHLRANTNQQVYDPVVVSLGPYHHGKPQFHQMEEFKEEKLNQFIKETVARDSTKDKEFFLREIKKDINTLRGNYEKIDEYSDEALVDIILRDACFLICFMCQNEDKFREIRRELGRTTSVFVMRDLNMLENQIPFWVIMRLLYFKHYKKDADEIVCNYLNYACSLSGYTELTTLPWNDDGSQPLHLLEAQGTTLLKRDAANEATMKKESHFLTKIFKCKRFLKPSKYGMSSSQGSIEDLTLLCLSVTYLQAKGIYIKPSSECLQDITFTSYHVYGVLRLPIFLIDIDTKVLLSNLIAFETSPGDTTNAKILAYVNFMKSLIDTTKDVKELREQGILQSSIGNDEEVVKIFKEINSLGWSSAYEFEDVRKAINKHCHNKAKTWMADLYYNYFRSPWAVVAIFVTTYILCLTTLQTYYTIHPVN